MFKLEMLVEDPKLVRVLNALDGLVLDLHVAPTRGAMVAPTNKPSVIANGEPTTGPELLSKMMEEIRRDGGDTISTLDALTEGEKYGIGKAAIYGAFNAARANGVLSLVRKGLSRINP